MTKGNVILTGASSGIGRAAALEFAANGYQVAAVGRNEEALLSLKKEAKDPSAIVVMVADLARDGDADSLVERCRMALGGSQPIATLVNCAGFAVTGRIEDIPMSDFDRCWKVNFTSAVSLCRQAIPHMRKAGQGLIVNVTSGVARRALPFASPYCSSKAALSSFTESLRVEVRPFGIDVQLFSPGPVATRFHEATVHHGTTDLHFPPFSGRPPAEIGKKLFHSIEARKERVVLGTKARVAHQLNFWSPWLTDKIVERMYKIERGTAKVTPIKKTHTG
jgi:short-subunit dehydrogenase